MRHACAKLDFSQRFVSPFRPKKTPFGFEHKVQTGVAIRWSQKPVRRSACTHEIVDYLIMRGMPQDATSLAKLEDRSSVLVAHSGMLGATAGNDPSRGSRGATDRGQHRPSCPLPARLRLVCQGDVQPSFAF